MITIKELSTEIQSTLCEKNPTTFKNVKASDIERILSYYNKIILRILKSGGFLTLPIYRFKRDEMCLRITPRKRWLIRKENDDNFWRYYAIKRKKKY